MIGSGGRTPRGIAFPFRPSGSASRLPPPAFSLQPPAFGCPRITVSRAQFTCLPILVRVINLNPDTDIGASAWFVEIEGHTVLLDAGVHPKREGRAGLPLFKCIEREELDAIVITHCHHDHVGALPVALQQFPSARVLMTELSYFLVERVLHNSVNVMERQRLELGIRDYPFFTHEQVDDYAPIFQGFKYGREIDFAPPHKSRRGVQSPTVEFHDAGHALGSAGISLRGQRQTLFYTGDVSFHDQTILRKADFADVQADVLIMETTRGAVELSKGWSRESELKRLTGIIVETLRRRGSVLIPAFALGRTQEILAALALQMDSGALRRQPIYIGGLGRVFSEIYDLESHRANRYLTGLKLIEALDLQVVSPKHVPDLKLSPGKIFVITSGMMVEHTAAHDLAVRMAEDPKHSILFVGYSDPDSPAGRLRAARPGSRFRFSGEVLQLTRSCQVEEFDLSAHAQRRELLDFVGQIRPKVVLLGHGDGPARAWFAQQIKRRWPRIKVQSPGPGQLVEVS